MATTKINADDTVTLTNTRETYSVTITRDQWDAALANAASNMRYHHGSPQTPEQLARSGFLNWEGRKCNAGSIGSMMRAADAAVDACMQHCPEAIREPARVCVGEFLAADGWALSDDGLHAGDQHVGWSEAAKIGCMYLAQYRTLAALGSGPCAEAIDRRLQSENPVSHNIALRLLERHDVREHQVSFKSAFNENLARVTAEYQLVP